MWPLLVAAVMASADASQTYTACATMTPSITCGSGNVISIVSANYGRLDGFTCGIDSSNTDCTTLSDTLAIVQDLCDGEETCTFEIADAGFTDACSGTNKYLTMTYDCEEAPATEVHGGWSPFADWSECSETCGGGTRTRTRTCTDPPPSNGGNPCDGEATETEDCNTDIICQIDLSAVDGGWSGWSAWSGCSEFCGGGTRERYRECNDPAPAGDGKDCVGDATQSRTCRNFDCPEPSWLDVMTTAICMAAGAKGTSSNGQHFGVRKDWGRGWINKDTVKSCQEVCEEFTEDGEYPTDFGFSEAKCTLSLRVYPNYRHDELPHPLKLSTMHRRLGLRVTRLASCGSIYSNYCCCSIMA